MLLRARVSRAVERLDARDASVLVALSGGADSVALLFVLRELEAAGQLRVAGAAHLNHQLRGSEADEDEAFCAALAGRVGVPFVSDRVDVRAIARAERRSVEDAARVARYAFLEGAADRLGADTVAVAHTKDDQAETFLLRLLRGAGTRGLAAIHPRNGRIIRPLLQIARAELREYLTSLGETFREDATNADVTLLRNRVRHELLPLLESRFSPRVADILAREAALARADEEYLASRAIELAHRVVLVDDGPSPAVRLDAAALRGAPRALASRVVRAALERLAGGKGIEYEHVDGVLALAADNLTGAVARRSRTATEAGGLSLPGQHAARVGDAIVLRPGRGGRTEANSFAFLLSIPGEVQSDGWSIEAAPLPAGGPLREWAARALEVGVATDGLALPLGVRSRKPGDRFRPLGAPGARKLQDFLVDRKVPRGDRERLPLVVDARDRIVWVPGLAVAEEFRVLDPSRGVILLKVRRLGGAS